MTGAKFEDRDGGGIKILFYSTTNVNVEFGPLILLILTGGRVDCVHTTTRQGDICILTFVNHGWHWVGGGGWGRRWSRLPGDRKLQNVEGIQYYRPVKRHKTANASFVPSFLK